MKKSLDYVVKRAENAQSVVLAGAGTRGRELLKQLEERKPAVVKAFFDNSRELQGKSIGNISVLKPCRMEAENTVYIIAVDSAECRRELRAQLLGMGIEEGNIVTYYHFMDYDYLSSLDESDYEDEIKDLYRERLGKTPDLEHPATYNEKINWEKLHVKDERRTRLTDKYLAREWVREQIGEKYLTKLLGVWDTAEEIDFEALPDAFVLKLNNGSGRNIVVKDKGQMDRQQVCRQLNQWKDCNFAYTNLEFHYKDIVPRIICEEYLEGVADTVYDYNIYCFHGEPEYIWCIKHSHLPDCQASFYNRDWEMQPFSYGYPKDPVPAPRPEKLEEMLELSRILSRDFEHVRVDWYNLPDGRILFGEMTFSTWGGLSRWEPEEYDAYFGSLI